MPDMPMPPMPTKGMGPIWFGSFMVSQTPGRPDTRSIGPKNGRPHKAIPLIWETSVFARSQSRAVNGHFRFRDALRPPHMHPKAIKTNAVEPALGRGGVKERREAEHLRRLASEQLRLDDSNAGIGEPHDMERLTRLEPSVVRHDENFGPGPSIQRASVWQIRNGPPPISGRARLIPPPWSSSFERSSEMMIFGARRLASCASIWSGSQCTLTIARSTPFSASRSRQ